MLRSVQKHFVDKLFRLDLPVQPLSRKRGKMPELGFLTHGSGCIRIDLNKPDLFKREGLILPHGSDCARTGLNKPDLVFGQKRLFATGESDCVRIGLSKAVLSTWVKSKRGEV